MNIDWLRFKKKNTALGVAYGKRLYDLPLTQKDGSGFVVLLVALMTFLVLIIMSGAFSLSTLSNKWSSGLENKMTIEIPAKREDGSLMSQDQLETLGKRILFMVKENEIIDTAQLLDKKEIQTLISPWLGHDDTMLDTLPFPVLIAIELKERNPETLKDIETQINKVAPKAILDTHKDWLNDLLNLTATLKYTAFLLSLFIFLTTATAIAGAVRSSMSAHHEDLELLHLMGATDRYITRQFQRYILILTLKGSALASVTVFPILGLLYLLSDQSTSEELLPSFSIEPLHFLYLFLCPLIMIVFSLFVARWTVLRSLEEMP